MKRDWLDLIIKLIGALGAVFAGIAIPAVLHYNGEKNRATQLYVQIMSQREQSDSQLRAQMFESLIKSYFGDEVKKDTDKQIMYLNLLSRNFQEYFDPKPLFDELDSKLLEDKRETLRKISREISFKQASLLKRGMEENGKEDLILRLCESSIHSCDTSSRPYKYSLNSNNYEFLIELLEINSSSVQIRVIDVEDKVIQPIELDVSIYDWPFMVNTKLLDGSRIAFILKNMNLKNRTAVIEILGFPEAYMSLRDRPFIEDKLSKLGLGIRDRSVIEDMLSKLGLGNSVQAFRER
jgi:hypothetical protein